jgi:hypothetical protein
VRVTGVGRADIDTGEFGVDGGTGAMSTKASRPLPKASSLSSDVASMEPCPNCPPRRVPAVGHVKAC